MQMLGEALIDPDGIDGNARRVAVERAVSDDVLLAGAGGSAAPKPAPQPPATPCAALPPNCSSCAAPSTSRRQGSFAPGAPPAPRAEGLVGMGQLAPKHA